MSSRPFSLSTGSGSATSGRAPQRRRRADSDDEHAGDHCGQASEQVHPLRARHAERLDTCHEGSRPILGGRPSQYPGQLLCRAETRGSALNRLRSRGSGNGGVVAGQHATGRGGLLPVRPWPYPERTARLVWESQLVDCIRSASEAPSARCRRASTSARFVPGPGRVG